MKTTFLKIATALLMLTSVNSAFAASSPSVPQYTQLTWIKNFYKIEAHGNVQLHLVTGEKTKVEMSSSYYDHNALVQVENGVLRITCYNKERLNVWVTISDLSALSAYDNVLVQTEGKFSALDLDVELFNRAKADLNLDCSFTNIKLNDRSMADISGTAMECKLATNYAATLNDVNFVPAQQSAQRIAPVWETRIEFTGFSNGALLTDMTDDSHAKGAAKELRFSSGSAKQIKLDIPADVTRINMTTSLIN